jgi:hypothetical protein
MKRGLAPSISRWGFAVACVLAPIVLGVLANGYFASWLSSGSELCAVARQLPFSLIGEATPSPLRLSAEDARVCDKAIAGRAAEAAPLRAAEPQAAVAGAPLPPAAAQPVRADTAGKAAAEKPLPPHLQLVANHIAGRLNVAYGYAFLALVSVVAFVFGSCVLIGRYGWPLWVGITAAFTAVAVALAYVDLNHGGVRRFVADNILARADGHALLQYLPASDNLRSLIASGLCIGYLSVGLVLASLFVASVRMGNYATLADLKERLFVIRVGLVLGSAILVVVVLSSRAVFDWPLSLLAEPDRKALAPAADALVRKWGAIGSISLIAAFLPAITAWYLDRECYRNTPHPPPAPQETIAELEIAPMSTVTSIMAVLAPVIASPIFDALKALATSVQKP